MKKFWMVKGAGATSVIHNTEWSAIAEAERLALLHPGQEFAVLVSVSSVKCSKLQWSNHSTSDRSPWR